VVRVEIVKVAWPPLREAVPRSMVPSLNVTLPVGVPVAGGTGATVAVSVSAWPKTEGLGEDARVIVVVEDVEPTVWVSGVDVLVVKFASPL
jgi:hypothetical protein